MSDIFIRKFLFTFMVSIDGCCTLSFPIKDQHKWLLLGFGVCVWVGGGRCQDQPSTKDKRSMQTHSMTTKIWFHNIHFHTLL